MNKYDKVRYEETYRIGEVIGISLKHNRLSFQYGDYGASYHVPLKDCKPYKCTTYEPNYLRSDEK